MTQIVLGLIGVVWLVSGVWALAAWDRTLEHSKRARQAHVAAGENGIFKVITEMSISIDRIGRAQGVLLLAVLANTFIPEETEVWIIPDVRVVIGRSLLIALGISIAVMADTKYRGETLSRELLRQASIAQHGERMRVVNPDEEDGDLRVVDTEEDRP